MSERLYRRVNVLLVIAAVLGVSVAGVHAGELGHYFPATMNVRDFFVPEPGFYSITYGVLYSTDRLNDTSGNRVRSVEIPVAGRSVDVDVDLDIFALSPVLAWVSPWEVLGARSAALIAPSFGNTSVNASLNAYVGPGVSVDESQFDVGDLYVQPVWLCWPLAHWDFSLGYGFYAPVGKYSVDTFDFPGLGLTVKSTAPDKIGLGFWTHQFQGGVAWYPWEHRATAVAAALTYEIHGDKEDFDITPGSHLSLNWGASQYVPLTGDQNLLVELGHTGYSQWKVTEDRGSDATGGVYDQVHAAGGQLGLTYVPWNAFLNARYLYEFASEARFQGQALSLSLGIKL